MVIFNWKWNLGDNFRWRCIVCEGVFPCIGIFNVVTQCRGIYEESVNVCVGGLL